MLLATRNAFGTSVNEKEEYIAWSGLRAMIENAISESFLLAVSFCATKNTTTQRPTPQSAEKTFATSRLCPTKTLINAHMN